MKASDAATITHGRHCTCSACARQDWSEPNLACCGMHGPGCPPVYAPLGAPGEPDPTRAAAIRCACCGKPIMADEPERASDGELVHQGCEDQYEDNVYFREFEGGDDA